MEITARGTGLVKTGGGRMRASRCGVVGEGWEATRALAGADSVVAILKQVELTEPNIDLILEKHGLKLDE